VFEHVAQANGVSLLRRIGDILEDDGKVIVRMAVVSD